MGTKKGSNCHFIGGIEAVVSEQTFEAMSGQTNNYSTHIYIHVSVHKS